MFFERMCTSIKKASIRHDGIASGIEADDCSLAHYDKIAQNTPSNQKLHLSLFYGDHVKRYTARLTGQVGSYIFFATALMVYSDLVELIYLR